MKQGQQAALQCCIKVNHQIAAAQQVEFGKRRIQNNIVLRKQHAVTDAFGNPVVAIVRGKKLAQPFRRHTVTDGGRVLPQTGCGNGVRAQVRGENLQAALAVARQAFCYLGKCHGQRIRLFSGRTTHHPCAQRVARCPAGQEFWQRDIYQMLPNQRIPEKAGHPNQQLLEQQVYFLAVVSQKRGIQRWCFYRMNGHAALDAAVQRVGLVV